MTLRRGITSTFASNQAEIEMGIALVHLESMLSWAAHVWLDDAEGEAAFSELVSHVDKFKKWFGGMTQNTHKANVPWGGGGHDPI